MKNMLKVGLAVAATVVSLGSTVVRADETVAKEKIKPYKLEKCIVSDEKLGEMGDPFVFNYKGQQIKLCCKNCKKDFDKDSVKFMKKYVEAEKAKKEKKA
jgi:hypothetical protein